MPEFRKGRAGTRPAPTDNKELVLDKAAMMTTTLPQRRPLRLRGYDYSGSGAYFITVCTQDRVALFGEIVDGEMRLNAAGQMVLEIWESLPERYPGWDIDVCVVMPDHFHGILFRQDTLDEEFAMPSGHKTLQRPGRHKTCPYGDGFPEKSLADVVGAFKSLTTHAYTRGVKQSHWPMFSLRLWQRNYYEHVVRNEQDLIDTRNYITNNSAKWQQHTVGAPLVGARNQNQPGGHKTRPYGWKQSGFTLVELIVVIVIVGILSALGGMFIVAPVTGYIDLSRRARLVDQAEVALRRMQRDVRAALPNSIRITGTYPAVYIEMLLTEEGGRYRRYPDPDTGGDILDFSTADTSFDVLGSLSRQPTAGQHLVIYNVTAAGATGNAYATVPDNRAAIAGTSTVDRINLSPGFQFANASPTQRFFVVDGPVTYACENGQLNRYGGYAISAAQPTAGIGAAALVTRGISGCEFSYDPGATQRAGLVTMRLTLEEQGEQITLLHQVHVVNAP